MPGPLGLVVVPGPLTLIEDAGRPGWRRDGVAPSGAFDRRALRLANRLVGNAEGCAVLEITLGGLVVQWRAEVVVAVAGAEVAVQLDGADIPAGGPWRAGAGSVLSIGRATRGLRAYLAVRGGIGAERVLGSRSRDVFGGLGPPPLRPGDTVTSAAEPPAGSPVWAPTTPPVPLPPAVGEVVVGVHPGPRAELFRPESVAALFSAAYTVTPDSNRSALRLAGPALVRTDTRELDPEPVLRGAIQVPGSGLPLVFGPDHPVTGGYPVVAVVDDTDTDLLAHLRPGQTLRFRPPGAGPVSRTVR